MHALHWSIDSLTVRGNTLFGFGWAFHEELDIINLTIHSTRNEQRRIYADFGKHREDVHCTFPNLRRSANSGFIIYGALLTPLTSKNELVLECELSNGATQSFAIPDSNLTFLNKHSPTTSALTLFRQIFAHTSRITYLIRNKQFGLLLSKGKRFIQHRPRRTIQSPSDLTDILTQDEKNNATFWIDHNLGGGANSYRTNAVSTLIKQGQTVILMLFDLQTLSPVLHIQNTRLNIHVAIPNLDFAIDALQPLSIARIVYNNGVSFTNPDRIPDFLVRLKKATGAVLVLLLHDYFMICPSQFLLDSAGTHCGIPEAQRCRSCLRENRYAFVSLYSGTHIEDWRAAWWIALSNADEIVAFSKSSATLLMKAFPMIAPESISVVPHTIGHLNLRKVNVTFSERLRIGVVGNIGFHKGAEFIHDLASTIRRYGYDADIRIIGTLEGQADSDVIKQTGLYAAANLPKTIESSGANVMLFPSIWPETFSYVVQEIMQMELPVAAFPYGAPAERLATYPLGLLLKGTDPRTVIEELTQFHNRLYQRV